VAGRDADEGPREPAAGRAVELTEPERELLLRALQRYRAAIPTYLKSREDERSLLDVLVRKLGGTPGKGSPRE
jgi:hypothetical protein